MDRVRERTCAGILHWWKSGVSLEKIASPVAKGRPLFTRDYSYSVMNRALIVYELGLEEQYRQVNQDLIDNCDLYIREKCLRDDMDNFYWSADLLITLYHKYLCPMEEHGEASAPLLREALEIIREMMWEWVRDQSVLADAEFAISRTWYIWNSENHHIQRFSTCWGFLGILAEREEFARKILQDGYELREHLNAWTSYAKEWIRERARKGMFVETSNGSYNSETLKGVILFYEYGQDQELRSLAGKLLDLYWALWAQEQLGGVRGGGKSRVYPVRGLTGKDVFWRLSWYYMGIGREVLPAQNDLTYLLSSYRIPNLIVRLALGERGVYEVHQRIVGLAKDRCYQPMCYHADPEGGGIVRYSYCTPDFIMGGLTVEPRPYEDWMMISSQNRWQGVIFSNGPEARIVIQCSAQVEDYGGGLERSYNQQWMVQSKGCMIVQKLQTGMQAGLLRVWMHESCMEDFQEEDGWIFVRNTQARCYAAIHIVNGGYRLDGRPDLQGAYLEVSEVLSPVIVEVAREIEYEDYAAFCTACKRNRIRIQGEELVYQSLSGDELSFWRDQSALPAVNQNTVNLQPDDAYQSPFVQGKWNGGRIRIQFEGKELWLDFEEKEPVVAK